MLEAFAAIAAAPAEAEAERRRIAWRAETLDEIFRKGRMA
jgi:hypothetical protein